MDSDDPDPLPVRTYSYPRVRIFRCRCGWHVWLIVSQCAPAKEKHVADTQAEAINWMDMETHGEPTC